jgi:signal peptidase I
MAAILAVGIVAPFRPTVVLGQSMAPTMRSGSLHLVDTRYYRHNPIRRGDVIIFRYQGETCAKRVYALPGDRLLVLHDVETGRDELVEAKEAPALRSLERNRLLKGQRLKELVVPPGHCFVLGDNRLVSWDRREFGFLPVRAIMGRVPL